MYYVGKFANLFYGLTLDEECGDITFFERSQKHIVEGEKYMEAKLVHELYSMNGLPDKEIVDDIYASFVAEHAQELSSFLSIQENQILKAMKSMYLKY